MSKKSYRWMPTLGLLALVFMPGSALPSIHSYIPASQEPLPRLLLAEQFTSTN